MTDVAAGLARVRAQIAEACRAAGRDPSEVGLVAVGKTKPVELLREAVAAGQLDLGENYAQELRDKAAALADVPGLRWHYVGRLQSNKAKYVGPVAYRVHALEEVRHAEALAAAAPDGVDALVAVNVGGEDSKGGVAPGEVVARVRALSAVPGVRIRGLMTIPPYREDPEDVGPSFAELASLRDRVRADGFDAPELSMGMSHDFAVAIRHGATWVRVGTAVFGAR